MPLPPPPPAPHGTNELSVFLGPDTCLIGTLSLAGNLRLDGRLEGELLGARRVTLGPSAKVKGQIAAQTVIVLGAHVEANIEASQAIELRQGAVVTGDLSAPQIHMDPDIEFRGRCELHPHPLGIVEGDPSPPSE